MRSAISRNTSAAAPSPVMHTGSPASPPPRRLVRAGPDRAAERRSRRRAPAPPPSPNRAYDVAVVAGERAHVLDHADHAQEAAPGHVGGALGDLLGGQGRGRHHDQVGVRQHPGQAHLHVAGAGRHVDQEVVEVAPAHVAQELFDRLGQHQAPPHERGVLLDEEAGRDDLQQAVADDALVGDDERLVEPSTCSASMRSVMPSRRGTENPQMSASSTPTVCPAGGERRRARLTVTELLPTPPLPLAMASTRHDGGDLGVRVHSPVAFHRALVITSAAFVGVHLAPRRSTRRSRRGGRRRASRPRA